MPKPFLDQALMDYRHSSVDVTTFLISHTFGLTFDVLLDNVIALENWTHETIYMQVSLLYAESPLAPDPIRVE